MPRPPKEPPPSAPPPRCPACGSSDPGERLLVSYAATGTQPCRDRFHRLIDPPAAPEASPPGSETEALFAIARKLTDALFSPETDDDDRTVSRLRIEYANERPLFATEGWTRKTVRDLLAYELSAYREQLTAPAPAQERVVRYPWVDRDGNDAVLCSDGTMWKQPPGSDDRGRYLDRRQLDGRSERDCDRASPSDRSRSSAPHDAQCAARRAPSSTGDASLHRPSRARTEDHSPSQSARSRLRMAHTRAVRPRMKGPDR